MNPVIKTGVSLSNRKSNKENDEPTTCDIISDYTHPSILIPDALINASTGLVAAMAYVFALQLNGLIKLLIDESSHHEMGWTLFISFISFIIVSYIGSMLIQIGKKWKYDMKKRFTQHDYNFDQ